MVTFECNGAAVVWRHNGMELTGGEKYQLEQRYLTIRDIVGSDEGNYTCTFNQETHSVGCLLVYGEIIIPFTHVTKFLCSFSLPFSPPIPILI